MAKLEHEPTKESKLWMIGMIGIIAAIALLVITAILIQHQELTVKTVPSNISQDN